MKKKFLFFAVTLLLGGVKLSAQNIIFDVQIIDPTPSMPGSSKTPTELPVVNQDGSLLTFKPGHDDYTLCLLDEDGFTTYSVCVPTSVTTVTLPTWLTGYYEIRLLPGGNYFFFGDITF